MTKICTGAEQCRIKKQMKYVTLMLLDASGGDGELYLGWAPGSHVGEM